MAKISVTDFTQLINDHINTQESLGECLGKIEALLDVALGPEFLGFKDSTLHNYLWVLDDMINSARMLNENSIRMTTSRLRPSPSTWL